MCHIALETHENNLEVVRQARQTIAVMGTAAPSAATEEAPPAHRPRSKRKPTLLRPVASAPLQSQQQGAGAGLKRDKAGSRK
jgi:hypothetical protein